MTLYFGLAVASTSNRPPPPFLIQPSYSSPPLAPSTPCHQHAIVLRRPPSDPGRAQIHLCSRQASNRLASLPSRLHRSVPPSNPTLLLVYLNSLPSPFTHPQLLYPPLLLTSVHTSVYPGANVVCATLIQPSMCSSSLPLPYLHSLTRVFGLLSLPSPLVPSVMRPFARFL